MKSRYLWPLALLLLSVAVNVSAETFKEGDDYEILSRPQPTETGDMIEVLELFWYGCPHCYKLEPAMEKWVEHIPEGVMFRRLPAIFRKNWEVHARAFYTAEALEVTENIHAPLFEAIHAKKRELFDEISLRNFFAEQGVEKELFTKTYNSFAVATKTKRAKQMTRRYGIRGVPAVIVNGKYRTGPSMAKGEERLMRLVNWLIEKEKTAAGK